MPRIRPQSPGDPRAQGRRAPILGTVVLGVLVAIASGAGLWAIHDSSQRALDREMGERLILIAEEIARGIDPLDVTRWSILEPHELADEVSVLAPRVESTIDRRGLNYVVIYDYEGKVLLDTSGLRQIGADDVFLFGEEREASQALESRHVAMAIGPTNEYLKSAFAPIEDPPSTVPAGHVAVHAAPDFFDTMRTLRGTLLAVGAALLLLLAIAVSVYLFYAQRLARAHAALARSEQLSAMGRMAAGIAHEIRNPLGIIKNTAQLLREELDDAGVETDLVKYIPEEVDRLNETLTGYLEFAKDAPLRRETVDLVELVRRTLKLVHRDFASAQVTIEHDLEAREPVEIGADSRKLQQVVLNLVLNGVQAMPQGGTLSVRIDAPWPEQPTMVALHVRDTGVGMDRATAEQIFEPFYTSKEKGSGLGLHVVQRIVEDHGGFIELETEPGEGTAFRVVLPALAPTPGT